MAAARRSGPGGGWVPRLLGPAGEVVAAAKGGRVLRAEDPAIHGQQRGVLVLGGGRIPASPVHQARSSSTQCWPQQGRALHGGTESYLLDEAARWQADDFWQYTLFAAVAYIRAAASRAGVPVRQACQDPAQRPGYPAP